MYDGKVIFLRSSKHGIFWLSRSDLNMVFPSENFRAKVTKVLFRVFGEADEIEFHLKDAEKVSA
jgi:hypothetical protein